MNPKTNFRSFIDSPASSIAAGIAVGILCILAIISLTGCGILLQGGGKIAFGLENSNKVVIEHTVDGDKQEKSSEARLDVDDWVKDKLDESDPDPK